MIYTVLEHTRQDQTRTDVGARYEDQTQSVVGEDGENVDVVVTVPIDDPVETTVPVYRLVVGHHVEGEVPVFDEDGSPVMIPTTTEDEEPKQLTEKALQLVNVEDFLFAGDDKRFDNKTDEEIAAIQRKLVLKEYQRRERQAKAEAANVKPPAALPGVGEVL